MSSLFSFLFRPDAVLSPIERTTHMHVIGQSGSGKSKGLEDWAMQDIRAGAAVGVIDPAGDLFDNLLPKVAATNRKTIVLDATDPNCPVRINPLMPMPGTYPERLAGFLADIVIAVYQVETAEAPRMTTMMYHAFTALIGLGLTLGDLSDFLLYQSYRNKLLPRLVGLTETKKYFTDIFPKTPEGARTWMLPLYQKLERLLIDPVVRQIVTGKPALDFRRILDEGWVLLVKVPKGELGASTSGLLAAFIVAMFQKAALSRADSAHRPQYHLYLDEFQNYTTENIAEILAETRKYRLSLILAHQYLDQLPTDLRSAVLNTVGATVAFRVGAEDARHLAPNIFRDGGLAAEPPPLQHLERAGMIPFMRFEDRVRTANWDRATQALVNRPSRQFWLRKRGNHQPVLLRTPDVMPLGRDVSKRIELLRYGSGMPTI